MGNAQSNIVQRKLSRELPPVGQMGHDANFNWVDKGKKVFTDEEDRRQFIGTIQHADSNTVPAGLMCVLNRGGHRGNNQ